MSIETTATQASMIASVKKLEKGMNASTSDQVTQYNRGSLTIGHTVKMLFVFFILAAISFSGHAQTATAPSAGSGSSGNPYQIATLNNLYWIYANPTKWDKHYIQTANINASATSSWNGGTGWMPIGNSTTKFTGSYDGNGYEISGLRINRSSTTGLNQGLFGVIENATLIEIRMISVSITGYSRVGAIAGSSINSSIDKCHVSGTVSTPLSSSSSFAGGWVGHFTNTSQLSISNGSNQANVSTYNNAGGFFGYTDAPINFTNCSNSGNITASGSSSASFYAGGLVGHATYNSAAYRPTYSNCSNTGAIAAAAGYAGGLVGLLQKGSMTDCSNSGNITSTNAGNLGGLVGRGNDLYINACTNTAVTISGANSTLGYYIGGWVGYHSYSDSIQISNKTNNAAISGYSYLGGFFGQTDAPVSFTNCHNTKNISASGNASVSYYAGGLVGHATYNSAAYRPTYSNCSNTGAIAAAAGYAGGLVGLLQKGSMTDCSNSGNITSTNAGNLGGLVGKGADLYINACTNTAVTISGANSTLGYYIGGWVGYHSYSDSIHILNKTNNTTISGYSYLGGFFGQTDAPVSFTNCHNTKNITASGNASVSYYAGGLVGHATYNSAAYRPTYSSCSNTGAIAATAGYAGGLVGRIYKSLFVRSSNSTNITSSDKSYVGGIIGLGQNAEIYRCYNTGNISAPKGNYVGGIIGYAISSSTMEEAYNIGSIRGDNYIGGISGGIVDGGLKNCYNQGQITADIRYSGGLVGILSSSNIYHSYSANTFSGSSTDRGGTVGINSNGTSTNAYWDTQVSGVSTTPSGTGFGRTTSPMQTQSNYVNWDFHTIWHLDSCDQNGYPILRWQNVDFANNTAEPSGLGTVSVPYEISSLDELYWLMTDRKHWDKHYIQTADIDVSAIPVVCGHGATPIGDSQTPFSGTYNGQYHTISDVLMDCRTAPYGEVGLFGYVTGDIEALLVEDVTVKGDNHIGGLVGLLHNNGTISECGVNSGSVSTNTASNNVGGLVGSLGSTGNIYRCFSNANVFSIDGRDAGGLVGYMDGDVYDSYARGSVTFSGTAATGGFVPGAFAGTVGYSLARIYNSYATGSVPVGSGFVGYAVSSSNSSNCFFDQQTTGQTTSDCSATPTTTAVMKTYGNYTSAYWDFLCENTNGTNDYWGKNGADNDGYPWLEWEGYTPVCAEWVGTIDEDWGTPGNWSINEVPAQWDPVLFSPLAVNHARLDQDRRAASIDFNNSGYSVILDNHDLTTTAVVNSGANAYVQTTGSGVLRMPLHDAGAQEFPVGKSSYNPVTITNNMGHTDTFEVRVKDNVWANGHGGRSSANPRVNRTWYIDNMNSTADVGQGVDFKFCWNPGEVVGPLNQHTLFHHNGNLWHSAMGNSTNNQDSTLSHSDYKGSFSPFAIGTPLLPLPVTWLYFDATAIDNDPRTVQLQWATANEVNNSHFLVEWSRDGLSWFPLGRVEGAGNSIETQTYAYTHVEADRINLYRLKQVDLDGQFAYSAIREVMFDAVDNTSVTIFPNPAQQQFTVATDYPGLVQYVILNANGQVVQQGQFVQQQTLRVKPGVYLLQIITNDQVQTKRVIVTG